MPDTHYWLTCLICAHILADFPFQPNSLIQIKNTLPGKMLHGAVHALSAYILCGLWTRWQLPVLIFTAHFLVDLIKKKNWRLFLVDQALHLFVLTGIALMFPFGAMPELTVYRVNYLKALILLGGVTAATLGASLLIGRVMQEIVDKNHFRSSGLIKGGVWIGQLERLMIFLLVFFEVPAGIGFLIAAKSILRFSETKDEQKMSEYVLIGTLLSFSLAILISFLVKHLLSGLSHISLTITTN